MPLIINNYATNCKCSGLALTFRAVLKHTRVIQGVTTDFNQVHITTVSLIGNFDKKLKSYSTVKVVDKTLLAAKLRTTWTSGSYWIVSFSNLISSKNGADKLKIGQLQYLMKSISNYSYPHLHFRGIKETRLAILTIKFYFRVRISQFGR